MSCTHPPGLVQFTNHGFHIKCSQCGAEAPAPRQHMREALNKDPSEKKYGPTMQDVALQCLRLDAALRAMGRAFWNNSDLNPRQEAAMEQAVETRNGFLGLTAQYRGILDGSLIHFPEADISTGFGKERGE